jgi:cytochrome c
MRRILAVTGVGVAAVAMLAGSSLRPVRAQDDAAKPAYYTEKVRPILEQSCGTCHLNGNYRGGLGLGTKAETMQGGDSGVVIVPGDPDKSLLVKLIRHEGPPEHPGMPPGRNKLSDEDIAIVTRWVKAGAVMPDAPVAGQGGPRGGVVRGQSMDLASAKKMVAAVEAVAEQKKQHVAICVMDTNGDIVVFERMNGTDRIPLTTSQGKARTVLLFGISTGMIADAQRDKKPVTAVITAPPIGSGGGEMTLMRGGLPIMKDGKMIGSIGVGGSASEEDEKFAQIGIDAAGLTSK